MYKLVIAFSGRKDETLLIEDQSQLITQINKINGEHYNNVHDEDDRIMWVDVYKNGIQISSFVYYYEDEKCEEE